MKGPVNHEDPSSPHNKPKLQATMTTTQQTTHNKQTTKQQIQELAVAKSELTSGDTTGLVYVQPSPGAVFFVTSRMEALRGVDEKINRLKQMEVDR